MEQNILDEKSFLESFKEWLEDHNYCKVTNCCRCYHWEPVTPGRRQPYVSGWCRSQNVQKWADDYCSDALQMVVDTHD